MSYHPYRGYTVVELLVVIVVIGLLAGVVLGGIQNSQAKSRDTQRVTDIDTLRGQLEAYYSDKGGYPNTFTAATFYRTDPLALKDPNGVSITISSPASSQSAALAAANPGSSANYQYIPYPTGCGAITCTGYVLKSYIEQPNADTPNPYIRYGLNNN